MITPKFSVWLKAYLHKSKVGTGARAHVCTPFPFIGSGWTDGAE